MVMVMDSTVQITVKIAVQPRLQVYLLSCSTVL